MPLATKDAYLVTHRGDDKRTYVCLDLPSVYELLLRLTGKEKADFALDDRGLPKERGILIAAGVHVYVDRELDFAAADEDELRKNLQHLSYTQKETIYDVLGELLPDHEFQELSELIGYEGKEE